MYKQGDILLISFAGSLVVWNLSVNGYFILQ
jgi:hypothetical protein